MILWNNTKAAVAAVLAVAVVIGGVSAVVHAVVAQRSPQARTIAVAANAVPTPPEPAVKTIETQGLVMAVSPDKKQLAAFSKATGQWTPMPPLANAAAEIDSNRIIVHENVGTYRDDRRVYAFSAVTGTWDTFTVTDGGSAPEVMIEANSAKVTRPKTFHIFSAKTGKWSEPPFQRRE